MEENPETAMTFSPSHYNNKSTSRVSESANRQKSMSTVRRQEKLNKSPFKLGISSESGRKVSYQNFSSRSGQKRTPGKFICEVSRPGTAAGAGFGAVVER